MAENKKSWVMPEMVVLARNTPQEAVLSGCKNGPIYTVSSNDSWGGCYALPWANPCAYTCDTLVAS